MSYQIMKVGFCDPWATGSSPPLDPASGGHCLDPHRVGPPSVQILASGPLSLSRALTETHLFLMGKGPGSSSPRGLPTLAKPVPTGGPRGICGPSASCWVTSEGDVLSRGLSAPSWLVIIAFYRAIHFAVKMDLSVNVP